MKSEQYLSGPNIWKEYEFTDDQGNNKWFHLFGDKHIVIPNEFCPKGYDFVDFLQDWFSELTKYKIFTDFYLEIPYKLNVKSLEDNSYLSLLYLKFRDCFIQNEGRPPERTATALDLSFQKVSKCKYSPYVNMFTTDIRSSYKFVGEQYNSATTTTVPQLIKNRILYLLGQLSKSNTESIKTAMFIQLLVDQYLPLHSKIFKLLITSDNYENDILKLLDPIFQEYDPDVYDRKDFDQLRETIKRIISFRTKKKIFILKHELDKLRKEQVKYKGSLMSDWISQFMIRTTEHYQKEQLDKFLNAWSNIYLELIGDFNVKKILLLIEKYQKDLNVPLTVIDSTLLDCYILSKSFQVKKNDLRRPVLCVIFEGSNHVDIQSIFFEQVLKIKPLHSVKGKKEHIRCLDVWDISKVFDVRQYAENVLLVKK
jgi:hypothetical protein